MFPEKRIMIKVRKEQEKKGDSKSKIDSEMLEFATQMAETYYTELVNTQNQRVFESINVLRRLNCWTNLGAIARHVYKSIEEIGKEENLPKDIQALHTLKRKVISMNIPDLKNVFKDNYLKENFPELV